MNWLGNDQKKKVFVYIDKLNGYIVGSFFGENLLEVKRFLMSLCYEALERSRFNLGALSVFIQREVWYFDFQAQSWIKYLEMSELVDEAVNSLQDASKVIRIKKEVEVVNERKEEEKQ